MAIVGRNRSNVLVGAPDVSASGGLTIGLPVTEESQIPLTASAAVDVALAHDSAGFISEDGITKTVDRSTEKIKDWNGDTVIITQSDHSVTLQFTFMEAANAAVLKAVYGEENVIISGDDYTIIDTADELPHISLDALIKGNASTKIRVFAPDAQITEVGDVNFVRSGVIQYQVTAECFDFEGKKLVTSIERTAPVEPDPEP